MSDQEAWLEDRNARQAEWAAKQTEAHRALFQRILVRGGHDLAFQVVAMVAVHDLSVSHVDQLLASMPMPVHFEWAVRGLVDAVEDGEPYEVDTPFTADELAWFVEHGDYIKGPGEEELIDGEWVDVPEPGWLQ